MRPPFQFTYSSRRKVASVMSDQNSTNSAIPVEKPVFVERLVYILALLLVLLGLVNVTPAIPGWDNLWKDLTGNEFFRIRRFPTEWLFPITFFWMMLIVAFKHSMWLSWTDRGANVRRFGIFMDAALIIAAAAISLSYLIEIEAVCLIDTFTGDRERLVAKALQAEIDFAELYGLPAPDTADDPGCATTTGSWLILIMFGDVIVFLVKGAKNRHLVTAFGNIIAHEIVDVLAIGRQNADSLCVKGVESGKSCSDRGRAGSIGPFFPDLRENHFFANHH